MFTGGDTIGCWGSVTPLENEPVRALFVNSVVRKDPHRDERVWQVLFDLSTRPRCPTIRVRIRRLLPIFRACHVVRDAVAKCHCSGENGTKGVVVAV